MHVDQIFRKTLKIMGFRMDVSERRFIQHIKFRKKKYPIKRKIQVVQLEHEMVPPGMSGLI